MSLVASARNSKRITLLLPAGRGQKLLQLLHEQSITTANLFHSRGSYVGGPINARGELIESEQDVLICIVDGHRAEDIFNFLFVQAEFDKPYTGFMFMEALGKNSHYALPTLD